LAHYQQKLQEAENNLKQETEEYEEGKKQSEEAVVNKKRQIAVIADVLKRSATGHF
jgi:hypothetical protein